MEPLKIDQLTALFFETARVIRGYTKPAKKTGVSTFLQMKTLRYISTHQNSAMQDVAKFLSVSPPSATSLIDGLVKSKMILRVPDSADRRIVRLKITAKGKVTLKKVHSDMMTRMTEVFGKLNIKDIDSFIRILQALHKTYKE